MANIIAFAEVFRPVKQSSSLCHNPSFCKTFASKYSRNSKNVQSLIYKISRFNLKKEREVEQVWKGREGNYEI